MPRIGRMDRVVVDRTNEVDGVQDANGLEELNAISDRIGVCDVDG